MVFSHRVSALVLLVGIWSAPRTLAGQDGGREKIDGKRTGESTAQADVRRQLERLYDQNREAFLRRDVVAIIDSLTLRGDTASAIVSQYLDRRALRPDNQYHRVQTWVTQRETWLRTSSGWRMWRVDQLRNQRRLVDGREQ